jgi:hypothetical protein
MEFFTGLLLGYGVGSILVVPILSKQFKNK